ncbi:MAG: glycosyltransferase family 4 protein [Lacisediminihabitans sp.]
MHIAIVSDYFLDFVGGAQTSMREQRLALTAAGHSVVMVSAGRGFRGGWVRPVADGLQIQPNFTLPGLELPVIPNNKRITAVLEKFFRENQIDVVHVQTEFGLAHAAVVVARRLGIPVVHTVHTFYWASEGGPQASVAPFLRWGLERFTKWKIPNLGFVPRPADNLLRNLTLGMATRVDAVVSPSAHQARDLEKAGVRAPVAVIPNPISTSPRPAVPLSIEQASEPRFLWVARCEPVKRPLVFAQAAIEALTALAATGHGFSVDFVGDGADLPALQRLAADYPQLRVQGSLRHDQVLDLMDAASAVVLTSLGFDNQPMTIAEAVSRERGVLYCDPKLREGLDKAGFLSETPDAAGLAAAIVALVSDPQLLVGLSKGAAADRSEFGAETYVRRILKVYRTRPTPP